ncbi:type II toxin-antitoxin system VapC family toxin [Methylobacterium sp. WL18]|jgi:ribonuclease VapC|uniref:type II toxin-antitoxin system VapC family toxin n=1 Tax=Methylobacterium sp. WL18 TaxID=2603897 RepID=UPI0011C9DD2F|nr:type II toxin-antitoxin system VapC family toxin [Methylobacterium sp. WL18]TXN60369.1 type II toxin-antitoxin system VapC family toxin [Methylobacterium sp. WL18]
MFVDASALTAILTDEADARALVARLQRARRRMTSPLAVWETVVAVARRLDLPIPEARDAVRAYLDLAGIEVLAVAPEAAEVALDAYDRFGKGRHPAGLNFGDCFAYACARTHRVPLLYKGNDFPLTDIEAG